MLNYDRRTLGAWHKRRSSWSKVCWKIDMDNVIRVLVAGFLLFGAAMVLLALLGDYLVGIR